MHDPVQSKLVKGERAQAAGKPGKIPLDRSYRRSCRLLAIAAAMAAIPVPIAATACSSQPHTDSAVHGAPARISMDIARAQQGPSEWQRADTPSQSASSARGYVAVITAREATDIAAELMGRLETVHVHLGDHVTSGQLLATIDDHAVRENLAVAIASRRAAEAALEQSSIIVAEAAAQLKTERALIAEAITSQQALAQARFEHEKAVASKQRAAADLAEHQARVAGLRMRLTKARITAPYDAVVSMRYLDPGAYVSEGTPIVRLITSDKRWLKFAVPSQDRGRIAVGTAVTVALASDTAPTATHASASTIAAVVRHVAPELEPASQMILVEATLVFDDIHPPPLKPGQAARVFLEL